MKIKVLKWILVMLTPVSLFAQSEQDDLGIWLMYFGQNRVSDKVSIHTEIQHRNHQAFPGDLEQLLLRTGVNVHLAPHALVSGGYAYITNHEFESEQSAPEAIEHRIWQQLILTQNLGRVKFEHRYRVEQRWVEGDYRNRFRYRVMVFIPFNNPTIQPGTWFAGIYDEIFVNTEQTFFDRNRLYGAIGYQLNKTTSFQTGILHQRVNSFGKWNLQFAVLFNPDFRKGSDN